MRSKPPYHLQQALLGVIIAVVAFVVGFLLEHC